jgi:pimeloyl-ACP methyl ester carboxylesterase
MFTAQPYTSGSIFDTKVTTAAWHTKPSWYVVAGNDRMIPNQGKSMAKQIKATTTILPSSHVPMQSHPKEVAAVIEQAAAGKSPLRSSYLV